MISESEIDPSTSCALRRKEAEVSTMQILPVPRQVRIPCRYNSEGASVLLHGDYIGWKAGGICPERCTKVMENVYFQSERRNLRAPCCPCGFDSRGGALE